MYLQENSINLTYKRSKIIEYSGLSDGTYTDVNSNGILGAIQPIGGVLHLYSSFVCWFRVITVLFCVLSSFHSWRSRWSRREEVGRYQNGWSTDTLGGLSEYVSEICMFHWWSFFLVKSNTSDLGTTVLKCQIIRNCKLLDIHIELQEFCYISWSKDMAAAIHGHGTRCRWVVSWPSHFITRERPNVAHRTGCCGGSTAMLDTVPCRNQT